LIVIVLMMLITTFYDSAFVPVMNAGAIAAVGDFATLIERFSFVEHGDPRDVSSRASRRISPSSSFTLTEVVMIFLRSLSIYWTFFLTNYMDMQIMTSLSRDTFRRVQELSFSYFDHTNSGWLIARMNNDTSSIGDVSPGTSSRCSGPFSICSSP
jgi:ABC-type multidrug transport system fused ATPase/permease subunit